MGRDLPGSVFKRCGCRKGRTGLRLGAACLRLGEEGHGSWFFSLDLPRQAGGPRRRVRRGGYATEQDARAALARMREPRGQLVTAADWLELWLTTRVKLRSSTLRGYSAHVRLHLVPRLGMVLLAELDASRLQRMFAALLGSDELSVATVRRVHSTLRTALNAAVREGLIGDNPAWYVQLPRARRPHAVVWTARRVKHWQRTGERPAVAVWTPGECQKFCAGGGRKQCFRRPQGVAATLGRSRCRC